jgi:predicted PolB exonuclease-like 3'-5' exonuclease
MLDGSEHQITNVIAADTAGGGEETHGLASDVLSSFDSRSKMKLNDLCRALNLPGKPDGIDGSQVEQLCAEGRMGEVADYCECDVVSTYRLWLLHELFSGIRGTSRSS